MNVTSLYKRILAVLVLVGLTVAVSPMAAAQTPGGTTDTTTQVRVQTPSQAIPPLSTPVPLEVSVQYCYQPQSKALLATPIQLSITDNPSWAIATVTPSTVYVPIQAAGTSTDGQQCETVTTDLVVQTTADAPAFQQGKIAVQAQAESNQGLAASSGQTQVPVSSAFFSLLNAKVPKSVVTARPQADLTFPVSVDNLGNAQTTVYVSPSNPEKLSLQVTKPSPTNIPSKQQGAKDNSATIPVSVQTPYKNGYLNRPDVLNLDITSNYAFDVAQKGMQTSVSLLITTKGFYVPGPGALLMLASMAGVALVLGRRNGLQDD